MILETFPWLVCFRKSRIDETVVITKIIKHHIRSQTNERSVWKEAVVLRRMGNPGETLSIRVKFPAGIKCRLQIADWV